MLKQIKISIADFGLIIITLIDIFSYIILGSEAIILTGVLSWSALYITFYGFYLFWRKTNLIINQYMLVWFSICIFNFGGLYLYAFGIEPNSILIFQQFDYKLINDCILYCYLGSIVLLLSALVIIRNKPQKKVLKINDNDINSSCKIIFIVLLFISLPLYFYYLYKDFSIVQLHGYKGLYSDISRDDSLWKSISLLYIPASLALCYLYKDTKSKYLFLLLLFIPIVVYMINGSRSKSLSILIALIYLWLTKIKILNIKTLIFLIVILIGLVLLIPIIAYTRSIIGNANVIDALSNVSNPLVSTLNELGYSMNVWIRLQHLIPGQYPFGFGISYIASILCIIPSFIFGGFSFAEYAFLASWITKVEGTSYGLGFSIFGEAYYNFGWFGIPFLFFVGAFMFIMVRENTYSKLFKDKSSIFVAISIFIFAISGRDSMYLSIRHIFYMIVLPILAINIILFYKTRKNRKLN